jgi:(2Fe-2S) ferredoxin/ubiquinone/menaquinone biosynthesis C-methylase UbiE
MELFEFHAFVCDQKKPEGAPCCAAAGSTRIIEMLRAEVAAQGLGDKVRITPCGSLGLCDCGPNMVVYPEGAWYSRIGAEDVPEIVREHFGQGRPVERLLNRDADALRGAMAENHSRRLAALKAHDKSGAMPDELSAQLRAFMESRVLLTAIELDLFTAVGAGASEAAVAARLGANPRATGMLMNALVALGMLDKSGQEFRNSAVSARYFMKGARNDARGAAMHAAGLWQRWSTLTECVREGTAVHLQAISERGEIWTNAFIAAMHHTAALRAPQAAAAADLAGVRRMLDVGGGSGAYSIAFAQAQPGLEAEILDLPAVIEIARRHVAEAGLSGRVKVRAGDLHDDCFGSGYDLVFISAICHILGPDENRQLLAKAFAALSEGGRVLIQDFILEPDRTAPRQAALFALNMLVVTRGGNCYTEAEYAALLREAGFSEVRRIRLPGPSGLISGRR